MIARRGIAAAGLLGLSLAACHSMPQPPAHTRRITTEVGGLQRTYLVHTPPGLQQRRPVVIMYHGYGGTAAQAMRQTGLAAKADAAGFIAAFPNGSRPHPGWSAGFWTNRQSWNDGSGRFPSGEANVDDVAFTRAMMEELVSRFGVDPRRVYLVGFSNGSSMALRAAAAMPCRFAAVATVASAGLRVPMPAHLDCPVSLLSVQGDADPLDPLEGGDVTILGKTERDKPSIRTTVSRWAHNLGCDPRPLVTTDARGVRNSTYGHCARGASVRLAVVPAAGHTWPGGTRMLPESLVGKLNAKVSANDRLWEFFDRHRQAAPR